MKQGVIRKFKFPENKITIIPNAPSEIKTDKLNKELDNMLLKFLGNEKNVLSNITLYAKHKNLELLIEAIKYIKENNLCKLKLIITVDKSENKEAQELISLIEKYNLQEYVLSVGNIKHENIHQVLGKSKVFIFPSYAETLGIPFIEAMKFKLPIIAADLGFSHDVCGEAAVYFKYNDSIELAKCIVDTLNNTEKIAKMKEESRMRSYMYDEKLVVREYLNLLK
ncbi:MAG: glycosyltransferase [Romboutsia sp.]